MNSMNRAEQPGFRDWWMNRFALPQRRAIFSSAAGLVALAPLLVFGVVEATSNTPPADEVCVVYNSLADPTAWNLAVSIAKQLSGRPTSGDVYDNMDQTQQTVSGYNLVHNGRGDLNTPVGLSSENYCHLAQLAGLNPDYHVRSSTVVPARDH